jgi:WD40 repeat protein
MRGRLPGRRSLVFLFALSVATTSGAAIGEPIVAMRMDHMILDMAGRQELLAVATQSGRVALIEWREGREREPLLRLEAREGEPFPPAAISVALSPTGRLCASVASDGRLWLHELPVDGSARLRFELQRPSLLVARFVDEDRLLLGDMRGEIALLDLETRNELYRRQLEYDPIYLIQPDPSGRRAAVGFRSSRIQILDIATGATVSTLAAHRDSVYGLAWLDTDLLASASKDKSLLLWSLAHTEEKPRRLLAEDHYLTALAAHPNGALLALPLEAHAVGLIRVADGGVERRFSGHTAPLRSLVFLDQGRRLVSAGSDARIFVWALDDVESGSSP